MERITVFLPQGLSGEEGCGRKRVERNFGSKDDGKAHLPHPRDCQDKPRLDPVTPVFLVALVKPTHSNWIMLIHIIPILATVAPYLRESTSASELVGVCSGNALTDLCVHRPLAGLQIF